MRSTFSGIEIARRSLQAHRQGLDVTGHNIANANSPGYSRQTARLSATDPFASTSFMRPAIPGQIGTGVHVQDIMRMNDVFIERQMNQERQSQGYWDERGQILGEIELTFLEPSESSIRNSLDLYWESMQELSKNPESQAARSVVRERGLVLTDAIHSAYSQFDPLRRQLDSQVREEVRSINSLNNQIVDINKEIGAVLAAGDSPNDLLDKRSILLDELAQKVDIAVAERRDGYIAVAVGGVTMIDGVHSRTMVAEDQTGDGLAELSWEGTNTEVLLKSGKVKAMLEGRDEIVPYYMDQMDELASTLVDRVNEIHESGYSLEDTLQGATEPSGLPFFEGNDAATIEVSQAIITDPGNIAASKNGLTGDGSNALRIAQLKQENILLNKTATPNEFLGAMVAGVGVQKQRSDRMVEQQEVLLNHLGNLRSSISGVSLDEELSNLMKFQHGYAAASRVMTTIDESISIIIERMGHVGR